MWALMVLKEERFSGLASMADFSISAWLRKAASVSQYLTVPSPEEVRNVRPSGKNAPPVTGFLWAMKPRSETIFWSIGNTSAVPLSYATSTDLTVGSTARTDGAPPCTLNRPRSRPAFWARAGDTSNNDSQSEHVFIGAAWVGTGEGLGRADHARDPSHPCHHTRACEASPSTHGGLLSPACRVGVTNTNKQFEEAEKN